MKKDNQCWILPEYLFFGFRRFYLVDKALREMEIDCEHHRLLLGVIQQIPELNDDLQTFLQTVNNRIFKNWI